MTTLQWKQGQNEISNGAGMQIIGSKAPDQAGLSPKELLEAALALCVSISMEKILERDEMNVDLNDLKIEVKASKAEGVTNRFTHFETTVEMPANMEEKYKKKLLVIVERACTIGNTITEGATIHVSEK
ncbi:OsmC family protein [Solibacillus sp. FSL H8-0538]|uniref:OsmC family protein n=1 Tax=Solibacillus sp. FSL H8-0538 TaxID=2921400 RepID=UPI0030FB673D